MNTLQKKRPLGIYVHIPFCVSKCIYCDFLSFPADDKVKEDYVNALCAEIKAAAQEEYLKHPDTEVRTIFFGGGTPSIIYAYHIVKIMNTIRENFKVVPDAEITIECNPGTITKEKLEVYKNCGINRLSIGLQSPDNKDLRMLGRIHTYEEFEESYITARLLGFDNINIDIMSAIPYQTIKSYQHNLIKVLALKPEHISAYSLIVEEGTKLYDLVYSSRRITLPTEEEDRQMYAMTKEMLGDKGYGRYEISNYAKEGYECRHNMSYWDRTEYIGFGLAAASLVDEVRFTNTSEMASYLANPVKNRAEQDILTIEDSMSEYMFLGLRMMKGVSEADFCRKFGKSFGEIYGDIADRHIRQGLMERRDGRIFLTDTGIDVSNVVMADYLL